MLKPQDIAVLLKLIGAPIGWTFNGVASELGLSDSAMHRSLDRAGQAGLYDRSRRKVNRVALLEFLLHGAKYVFPAVRQGEARGIPTAWAAPPLRDHLLSGGENPPVWPDALGEARGIALEPLYPGAVKAAREDPELWEMLALLDSIRIGDARERGLAAKELELRIEGG